MGDITKGVDSGHHTPAHQKIQKKFPRENFSTDHNLSLTTQLRYLYGAPLCLTEEKTKNDQQSWM